MLNTIPSSDAPPGQTLRTRGVDDRKSRPSSASDVDSWVAVRWGVQSGMPFILALNSGSSTCKFGVFDQGPGGLAPCLRGRIEMHGEAPRLLSYDPAGAVLSDEPWPRTSAPDLLGWLEMRLPGPIAAVGHRVVHGGPRFCAATLVTEAVLAAVAALAPLAPLHQSQSLAGASALRAARPGLPQVLCFDTAFHAGHDPVVDRFALPRVWEARGLRRYGFHGLSYEYLAGRLAALDPPTAAGRVVAAHLGGGASLCALRDGRSIDTTMGATPLDGLVMATRCGSLDAGAVLYLLREGGLDADGLTDLLYRQSGLLGVSGLSGDMRDLLESREPAAREALDLSVHRAAREMAALAASLGGLDGLVFTAGVGENAPRIRAEICARLGWLGVRLDAAANERGAGRLNAADSAVAVWMIPTDEEVVIARQTAALLDLAE